MSELTWIGLVFYLFSVISIGLLATSASGKLSERFEPKKELITKISIIMLIASAGYWYLTVPYASQSYDFSSKFSASTDGRVENDTPQYIQDHHSRIERLEDQFKLHSDESRRLREHYELIVQLLFHAVVFFGLMLTFVKNAGRSGDASIKFNLKE